SAGAATRARRDDRRLGARRGLAARRRLGPSGRLRELEAVALRIRAPAEAAVLVLAGPLDLDARGAQLSQHRVEIADAVVHHRLPISRPEVLGLGRKDRPDERLPAGRALYGAVPVLDFDAEVLGIPRHEQGGLARPQEHTADAGDALHVGAFVPW